MTSKQRRKGGVLIAESVVASFLMLFAFVAASALFDAALRWESSGSNLRQAALLADRRMEELRRWVASTPSGASTFPDDAAWATEAARIPFYPEMPGHLITVTATSMDYAPLINTGVQPPSGFHSPCSSLYTDAPGTGGVTNPNTAVPFLVDNPQFNNVYETYSYSRDLSNSYKLVEVLVEFGNAQEYRLVSVIGDPMLPGPATVNIGGASTIPGDCSRQVQIGGRTVPDVSTLWFTNTDIGSGNQIGAFKRPLDSVGNDVSIQPFAGASGNHALKASVRYKGVVYEGTRDVSAP